jgi:predicted RNase H-like HicB family nuclease
MLVSSYSTTVGGKHYSGSVEESDGEYTASVSGLSGASASGSSADAAENNLTTRINELV